MRLYSCVKKGPVGLALECIQSKQGPESGVYKQYRLVVHLLRSAIHKKARYG